MPPEDEELLELEDELLELDEELLDELDEDEEELLEEPDELELEDEPVFTVSVAALLCTVPVELLTPTE